jgi:hypothetical protein
MTCWFYILAHLSSLSQTEPFSVHTPTLLSVSSIFNQLTESLKTSAMLLSSVGGWDTFWLFSIHVPAAIIGLTVQGYMYSVFYTIVMAHSFWNKHLHVAWRKHKKEHNCEQKWKEDDLLSLSHWQFYCLNGSFHFSALVNSFFVIWWVRVDIIFFQHDF